MAQVIRGGGKGVAFEVVTTPEEGLRFKHFAQTTTAVVGYTVRDGDDVYPLPGSGTIVRLANRDFLFTAGHNIEDCKNEDVWIGFMGNGRDAVRLQPASGAGSSFIRPNPDDPDVAVIELPPARRSDWQAVEPFLPEDLALAESVGPSDCVLLCGCPGKASPPPGQVLLDDGTRVPHLIATAVPFSTAMALRARGRTIRSKRHERGSTGSRRHDLRFAWRLRLSSARSGAC